MRWNDRSDCIWSEYKVHDALISAEDFEGAQQFRQSRARGTYSKKGNLTPRPYVFRGCLSCGYCTRKMQGNWNNQQAYYRYRFPTEYAVVNELNHPKVVYLREAEILGDVDGWLATAFTPDRIASVIDMMADQLTDPDAQKAADLPCPVPGGAGRRSRPRGSHQLDQRR
ncbi:hypothetical protein ACH35V_29635 [Actinomadura sp. 1N219]|uniref:hypothetical protein n=1 Tax=Actinomadura sp. 1N219 TaxID=3375152 RepID=UPI0037A9A25C